MRCKVGDLAVYVGWATEHLGRLVTCVAYAGLYADGKHVWIIDPPLINDYGIDPSTAYDTSLQPIRDNDQQDEMLRLLGSPQKVAA